MDCIKQVVDGLYKVIHFDAYISRILCLYCAPLGKNAETKWFVRLLQLSALVQPTVFYCGVVGMDQTEQGTASAYDYMTSEFWFWYEKKHVATRSAGFVEKPGMFYMPFGSYRLVGDGTPGTAVPGPAQFRLI